MKMKAITIPEPGKIEVREVEVPKPGPYQALMKVETMALCNSTDRKLVEGHFPGMETYPMVLGHENAGIVVEVGEKASCFKVGDRVLGGMVFDFGVPGLVGGWGGFCEYVLVNDHDAMARDGIADAAHGWYDSCIIQNVLPEGVGADEAALLCTWREVYGGLGDFGIIPDGSTSPNPDVKKVLVYGGGPVGLSFVKFMKILGIPWVGLVDGNVRKHAKALEFGADAVFTPDQVNFPKESFDVIIDAVGNEGIVNAAIGMIRLGGTIGVYGVISQPTLTLEKGKGPYNFNLIVHQWPTRRRERAAMGPLSDWIRAGKLSAAEFVTHRFPAPKIADAFAALKAGEALKILMTW